MIGNQLFNFTLYCALKYDHIFFIYHPLGLDLSNMCNEIEVHLFVMFKLKVITGRNSNTKNQYFET